MSLVVKRHRPWRTLLLLLGLPPLFAAGAWVAFEQGRLRAGLDFERLEQERRTLRVLSREQEGQIRELREQAIMLERSAQVDRQARDAVKAELDILQSQLLSLREELAFYRTIVSPADNEAGLRVQSLEIRPMGGARMYHYKLVLAQPLKREQAAQGSARLQLEGMQGDKPRRLSLTELGRSEGDELYFRFKYFQTFEGNLRLPDGFRPQRMVVELAPKGGNGSKVNARFDWPADSTARRNQALPRAAG